MRNTIARIVPLLVTLAALGCSRSAPATGAAADTAADKAAINATRERELALAGTGNIDSMLTVYTTDVVFMPPNEPGINGQDAVRKWGEAMFKDVDFQGHYDTSDITLSGDWAVDRYTGVLTVTPKSGGSPMKETIKGIHIMKRQPDGTWLIAQDVWNADAPPPVSPPQPAKK